MVGVICDTLIFWYFGIFSVLCIVFINVFIYFYFDIVLCVLICIMYCVLAIVLLVYYSGVFFQSMEEYVYDTVVCVLLYRCTDMLIACCANLWDMIYRHVLAKMHYKPKLLSIGWNKFLINLLISSSIYLYIYIYVFIYLFIFLFIYSSTVSLTRCMNILPMPTTYGQA